VAAYSSSALFPTPGSPRRTSAPLRPARPPSSSRSSAAHSADLPTSIAEIVLRVGQRAARDEPSDLQLLRRQLAQRARVAFASRLSRGAELVARTLLPRSGPELLEPGHRGAKMIAGLPPPAVAPQELPEEKLDTCVLERAECCGKQFERFAKAGFCVCSL